MRGAALILVIAILAALMAIAAPFALSMRTAERTARGYSAALRADLAARAAREIAVRHLLEAHPELERRRAEAEGLLADSPEDWTETAELLVPLADLPGATSFEVRDPRGIILAATIEDEQGKIDLNSATPQALGALIAASSLVRAIDEKARAIEVEDASRFFRDGDSETFDGLLAIGEEIVAYRDIQGNAFVGCERGALLSAQKPEELRHPAGELVADARGLKLALTPFWLEPGDWRPFERVSSLRDVALWRLVDAYVPRALAGGGTAADLRALGLGASGAGPLLDGRWQRILERAKDPRLLREARDLLARLEEARDLETFSARELEELRPYLTVSSVRPAEWAGGALVLSRIEPDPNSWVTPLGLGVTIPAAAHGAAARIEGPGGAIAYGRALLPSRSPARLFFFPQTDATIEAKSARVWVAPRHPLNVNTAPRRALEAALVGIELRGARSKDSSVDLVTPREAAALAARIVERPLRSHEDLDRILREALAANEISALDAKAILLNAMDPGHPLLYRSSAPFVYRSGGTATIVATGIVNDAAGNELARRVLRDVVAVSPPEVAALRFDSQADFFYEARGGIAVAGRR